MPSTKSSRKPRIVVIGAGFGGLAFIRSLKHRDAEMLLFDKKNHHLFQPLLYQVATSALAAPEIAQPIRALMEDREDVTVRMQAVEKIEPEKNRLKVGNQWIEYDYLVLAPGSTTAYFGNDHWKDYAHSLKTLKDAHAIRNQILHSLEAAETETDPEYRDKLMTIVVIGGGPTGVEMAGALAELYKRVLTNEYKSIDTSKARIILAEAMDRILPMYSKNLSQKAQEQLQEIGVEVRTGKKVQDIKHQQVVFEDETIPSGTIIWTAGVSASPLTQYFSTEKDKAGKLKVAPDCSLPEYPNVFAVGDIIHLVDADGKPVPGIAQGALQTGRHIAGIIDGLLSGKQDRHPFRYEDRGNMATIGRKHAVAEIKGREFSGAPAWLLWLGVHLIFLVGLRNRIVVFIQWIYSYLAFRRGARIIWGKDD